MPLWKVQAFDMQNQYSRSDFLNFRISVIIDEVRSFKRNGLRGRLYAGCRTGSVLVLEPIFEADLEPEQFGSTIGLCRSTTGKSYIGTRPSAKKVKRLCRAISEQTSRRWGLLDVEELVGRLNSKLDGWANYFWLGQVSKAYRAVDSHARRRLRHWLCRKHHVGGRGRVAGVPRPFPGCRKVGGPWYVVLEDDPMTVNPMKLKDIAVWGTVFEGKVQLVK